MKTTSPSYEFSTKDNQIWKLSLVMGLDNKLVWHLNFADKGSVFSSSTPQHSCLFDAIDLNMLEKNYPHVLEWCRDVMLCYIAEPHNPKMPIYTEEQLTTTIDGVVAVLRDIDRLLAGLTE